MCIISFHLQDHPKYKFILAANRDEFYERPTKEAQFWEDHPTILAGRDLEAMGTWLGVTKQGRFAALTNYRDPTKERDKKQSRGEIVTSFLLDDCAEIDFLNDLKERKEEYNGFNLLVSSSFDDVYYYGNQQANIVKVSNGTHSVSNHLLNTPWPKVNKIRDMLAQYVTNNEEINPAVLFAQLQDNELFSDHLLPDTGVGLSLERKLSPIFIKTDNYGTRSSTVLLVSHENEVTFIERTFQSGIFRKENKYVFHLRN